MPEDYYKTLGISRSATDDEIHRAYRDLARKYHPDLNPDDNAAKTKFQEIQQAYEILKDPKKREMFDHYGAGFESMSGGGPGGPSAGGPWRPHPGATPGGANYTEFDFRDIFGEQGPTDGGGFADLFRQFTGGRESPQQGREPNRPTRGNDIQHQLEVPFRTSISGGSAQLNIRRPNGKVETIDVKIPAGIEAGKKIRVRGQGDAAPPGGKPGDILISIRVAPHPAYTRQDLDLVAQVPITLSEAIFGAKIDVPTPKGTITLTVPKSTSSGKRLRVKGHGVETKDKCGDLYAEIQIVLPENIDEETLAKLKETHLPERADPRSNLVW